MMEKIDANSIFVIYRQKKNLNPKKKRTHSTNKILKNLPLCPENTRAGHPGHPGTKVPAPKEIPMQIKLNEMPVRFTADGKLYIVDAIAALAGDHEPKDLWETLKRKQPQINQYVDYHHTDNDRTLPITDSDGWDHIQDHLFDHIIETAPHKE